MQKSILVCDIGFGYTKFIEAKIENNKAFVILQDSFPSVIRRLLSSAFFQIKDHPDYIEIKKDTKEKCYLVGHSATENEKGIRIRNSEFLLDIFPLLLKRVLKIRKETSLPSSLVVGTPFQEWNRLKEQLVKIARECSNIEKVECYPQAASAACNLGKKCYNSLVVDIGFNTTDVVPIDATGRIISDQGVSWEKLGVSMVLEDLENFIKKDLGLSFTSFQIEKIFITPSYIGRIAPSLKEWKKTILEIKNQIVNEYTKLLHAKLIDRFGKNKKLVLAGGGAKFLNKPFKKLGWQIVSLKEPQFANAKGFLKLGLAQEGFTGEIIWEKESQKQQKMTDIDIKDKIQKKENNLVTITTDSNSETKDNMENKRGEANEASNH